MKSSLNNYDSIGYRMYTGKAELDKAMATLKGLVEGMTIDGIVDSEEINELINWVGVHSQFENSLPFSEVLPIIREFIKDGIIDDEEIKDLLWMCKQFSISGNYYDIVTLSIQELEGIFHGILSNNKLTDLEINNLYLWIKDHHILKGTYPYDEIEAIISDVLGDGIIEEYERLRLKAFMGEFVDCKNSCNLVKAEFDDLKMKYDIKGICAKDPIIELESHFFCFTGKSSRATRNEIQEIVITKQGFFNDSIIKKTEYLLVGDEGNPCWAFSCYGRKVEKAVELRKKGFNILIVHENDFWKLVD